MDVQTVIGDMAYSEKENLIYTKTSNMELIAKLNPMITQGNRKIEDEFEFNKDAACTSARQATWRSVKLERPETLVSRGLVY